MNVLQMSFSGAVMILLIIVIRALAVHKFPKKVFRILWGLVLLRLLLPLPLSSGLSVYSIVAGNTRIADGKTAAEYLLPVVPAVQNPVSSQNSEDPIQTAETTQNEPKNKENKTLNVRKTADNTKWDRFAVLRNVWIGGMVSFILYCGIAYVRGIRIFREALPVENFHVKYWMARHKLKRKYEIRETDRIAAPLTYGIFRPVILLPKKADWEDEKQLDYVLEHEYTHIRHWDVFWKLILNAAVCIHWFNPLVWAMYILANRDIELACDEAVIQYFGEMDRSKYALTLLHMEETRNLLLPLGNHFGNHAIEERIAGVMKTRKVSVGIKILAAVLVVVIAVGFATFGKEDSTMSDEKENKDPVIESQEAEAESGLDPETIPVKYSFDLEKFCREYNDAASEISMGLQLSEKAPTDPSKTGFAVLVLDEEIYGIDRYAILPVGWREMTREEYRQLADGMNCMEVKELMKESNSRMGLSISENRENNRGWKDQKEVYRYDRLRSEYIYGERKMEESEVPYNVEVLSGDERIRFSVLPESVMTDEQLQSYIAFRDHDIDAAKYLPTEEEIPYDELSPYVEAAVKKYQLCGGELPEYFAYLYYSSGDRYPESETWEIFTCNEEGYQYLICLQAVTGELKSYNCVPAGTHTGEAAKHLSVTEIGEADEELQHTKEEAEDAALSYIREMFPEAGEVHVKETFMFEEKEQARRDFVGLYRTVEVETESGLRCRMQVYDEGLEIGSLSIGQA